MANKIAKIIGCIVFCQLAGIIGSIFTSPAIPTWYAGLQKPSFNPPNWIFAPVWITLFTLMGVALYLVIEKGFANREVKVAVAVFGVQLVLNVLWSFLFFGLQSPFYGFVEIIFLWLAIVFSVVLFYGISEMAAVLLLPYLIWVSFAVVLNFYIWKLNSLF